jgi:hypothetical protein
MGACAHLYACMRSVAVLAEATLSSSNVVGQMAGQHGADDFPEPVSGPHALSPPTPPASGSLHDMPMTPEKVPRMLKRPRDHDATNGTGSFKTGCGVAKAPPCAEACPEPATTSYVTAPAGILAGMRVKIRGCGGRVRSDAKVYKVIGEVLGGWRLQCDDFGEYMEKPKTSLAVCRTSSKGPSIPSSSFLSCVVIQPAPPPALPSLPASIYPFFFLFCNTLPSPLPSFVPHSCPGSLAPSLSASATLSCHLRSAFVPPSLYRTPLPALLSISSSSISLSTLCQSRLPLPKPIFSLYSLFGFSSALCACPGSNLLLSSASGKELV